ncbi:hypothetical protein GGR53DRAFT_529552 [Hypoxylon sp. FL1150]|nr:hypothetical protein GGR53DRAFT_529552 [Hypoxylon sp. FL1150]
MSRPTIRCVISQSNMMLAAENRAHPPQIQPTRDPGLASSPSTFLGLYAMGIESPHTSNDSVNTVPADEPSEVEPKPKKMQRLWAAVKRVVRRPKTGTPHPFADAVAGGPGTRILVTSEVDMSDEPGPSSAAAGKKPVAATSTAVSASASSPIAGSWDERDDRNDEATLVATATVTAPTPVPEEEGKKKKKGKGKGKERAFSRIDEEDDEQTGETSTSGFVRSFSRNFRKSVSRTIDQTLFPY